MTVAAPLQPEDKRAEEKRKARLDAVRAIVKDAFCGAAGRRRSGCYDVRFGPGAVRSEVLQRYRRGRSDIRAATVPIKRFEYRPSRLYGWNGAPYRAICPCRGTDPGTGRPARSCRNLSGGKASGGSADPEAARRRIAQLRAARRSTGDSEPAKCIVEAMAQRNFQRFELTFGAVGIRCAALPGCRGAHRGGIARRRGQRAIAARAVSAPPSFRPKSGCARTAPSVISTGAVRMDGEAVAQEIFRAAYKDNLTCWQSSHRWSGNSAARARQPEIHSPTNRSRSPRTLRQQRSGETRGLQ